MRVCILFLAALCFSACSPKYSDFFPYHDDGTMKPNVCLLPIEDHSDSQMPYNLASRLNEKIRKQIMQDGRLFIPQKLSIEKKLHEIKETYRDTNLVATSDLQPFLLFQPAHFVIVLDLIEHRLVPYQRGKIKPIYLADIPQDQAAVLQMKMRLRVVDIRGGTPRVVRQELIESNHMVDMLAYEEACKSVGKPTFGSTQLAIAYARLCDDIVAKIEQLTCFRR